MAHDIGILVGCDQNQEWMLSWWFSHFRKTNPNIPVAFADFGMSSRAKTWCEERGVRLDIPSISSSKNNEEPGVLFLGERWLEWIRGPSAPSVCFAKASAMILSPFYRTLWLDLDCQLRGDLSLLFSLPLPSSKLRMRKAEKIIVKNCSRESLFVIPTYNSGVILYENDSFLLKRWKEACESGIHYFTGDDYIVSLFLAFLKNEKIALPLKYNWNATHWGENPEALIYHWQTDAGKNSIYLQSISMRGDQRL